MVFLLEIQLYFNLQKGYTSSYFWEISKQTSNFPNSLTLRESKKHCVQTFSKVARLVIVPELQGFIDPGRCTTWYSCSKQSYKRWEHCRCN